MVRPRSKRQWVDDPDGPAFDRLGFWDGGLARSVRFRRWRLRGRLDVEFGDLHPVGHGQKAPLEVGMGECRIDGLKRHPADLRTVQFEVEDRATPGVRRVTAYRLIAAAKSRGVAAKGSPDRRPIQAGDGTDGGGRGADRVAFDVEATLDGGRIPGLLLRGLRLPGACTGEGQEA